MERNIILTKKKRDKKNRRCEREKNGQEDKQLVALADYEEFIDLCASLHMCTNIFSNSTSTIVFLINEPREFLYLNIFVSFASFLRITYLSHLIQ